MKIGPFAKDSDIDFAWILGWFLAMAAQAWIDYITMYSLRILMWKTYLQKKNFNYSSVEILSSYMSKEASKPFIKSTTL